MTILLWLRAMGDLAFYYSFAGFIVALTGHAFSLPGVLVPSLLYALSRLAGERRPLRLAILLPALLCFLLPGIGTGDRIALIPAVLYAAYLAWTGSYNLSHSRQTETFSLFCKLYPAFFLMICLYDGFARLTTYSLPFAVLTVTLCVFLTRTLRHDPDVYLQPRFLMSSLMVPVLFLGAAWVLHLPAVIRTLKTAVLAVYRNLLAPAAAVILFIPALILSSVLSPLLSLLGGHEVELEIDFSMEEIVEEASAESGDGLTLPSQILKIIGTILVIVLVIAVLLYLFRRLAGERGNGAKPAFSSETLRHDPAHPDDTPGTKLPQSPLHPVNQVRRQYRRYLQLCRKRGFTPPESYTSREISEGASDLFADNAPADSLRELYINARYNGSAAQEDAAAAKELVEQLKKTSS